MKKFVAVLALVAALAIPAAAQAHEKHPLHPRLHQHVVKVVSAPASVCPANFGYGCTEMTAVATCPQGYKVTGGGIAQGEWPVYDATVVASEPVSGAWEVTMRGNTSETFHVYTFRAVAVCDLTWLTTR